MDRYRSVDDIKNLSLEETLSELGKELRSARGRLNLREYFQLLEWAKLYVNLPADGAWTTGIGYEIAGVRYGLLFSREEAAAAIGAPNYIPKLVRVREMLEHLEDGWGLIVDYGTEAEVRLSPDELTEENERIRIKPVRQEATDSWLAETNGTLKQQGIERSARAAAAKNIWQQVNGFRALPDSRRSRRIDWYFDVVADATASEAAERCEALWRGAYAADAYLHHLDQDDLRTRTFAIKTNSLFTDRKALPHELDEREWRELLEHVRYEYERRGLAFSDSIPVAERLAAWPRLDIARNAFAKYSGPTGQLYKFGEFKYLEPMLREGNIRIFPAARYDDPSFRPAQRDNELERTVILDGKKMQLTHTGKDGVSRRINAVGKATLTARSATNFYVWCTSTTFDPRMFDDFGADACLIIHDAGLFIQRMHDAMENALPGWPGCETLVHYYDPVRPGDMVLSPRDKEFRYTYQREYRFLWDPPFTHRGALSLDPIDLRLGNLEDVAVLLKL
jgi:hypothetical protein